MQASALAQFKDCYTLVYLPREGLPDAFACVPYNYSEEDKEEGLSWPALWLRVVRAWDVLTPQARSVIGPMLWKVATAEVTDVDVQASVVEAGLVLRCAGRQAFVPLSHLDCQLVSRLGSDLVWHLNDFAVLPSAAETHTHTHVYMNYEELHDEGDSYAQPMYSICTPDARGAMQKWLSDFQIFAPDIDSSLDINIFPKLLRELGYPVPDSRVEEVQVWPKHNEPGRLILRVLDCQDEGADASASGHSDTDSVEEFKDNEVDVVVRVEETEDTDTDFVEDDVVVEVQDIKDTDDEDDEDDADSVEEDDDEDDNEDDDVVVKVGDTEDEYDEPATSMTPRELVLAYERLFHTDIVFCRGRFKYLVFDVSMDDAVNVLMERMHDCGVHHAVCPIVF